jgi:hypothetical protein
MRTQFSCLALAVVLLCPFASAQWVQMHGPEGGFVQSFAFCGPFVMAGTYEGGVYRSSDYGGHWSPASDGLTHPDVYSLVVCDGFLFAGTGIGVFSSSDQGSSWQPTALMNGNVWSMIAKGSTLFAATTSGVFRSTDYGTSWSAVSAGNILSLATDGTTIFAGTGDQPHSGVFRSTNSGASWDSTGLSGLSVNSLAVNGTDIYAGTLSWPGKQDGGGFRSTDNGVHWTKVIERPVMCFAVSGTTTYAGGVGFVFRSTDQGATWTDLWAGSSDFDVRSLAAIGGNLFAGGSATSGVLLSTNGGDSWRPVNTGLCAVEVEALIATGTTVFAGASWGVFRSTDRGENWTRTEEYSGTSFAVNGSTLYVGHVGGGVSYSEDDGNSFHVIGTLPSNRVTSLAVIDTNVFAGEMYSGLFRSRIGGTVWTPVGGGGTRLAVCGTDLYAAAGGTISRSTDRGESWTPLLPWGSGPDVYALVFAGSKLYKGTWGQGVMMRTDCDTNRRQDDTAGTNCDTAWTSVNNGLTDPIVLSLAVVGSSIFAGTHNGGIFLTTNKGSSWTDVSSGRLRTRVWAIGSDGTNAYVCGGNGIWRRALSEMLKTSVGAVTSEMSRVYGLKQNYPNPFNPSTTITFELPTSSHVRLSVFDLLGREVSVLVNEKKDAGIHDVTFDAAGLASGMYFYRLQAGRFAQTKKLLLLR